MSNYLMTTLVGGVATVVLLGGFACTSDVTDRSASPTAANANAGQPSAATAPTLSAEERKRLRKQGDSGADYPWISAEDLKARLDRREKTIIVNTRSALSDQIVAGAIEVSELDIEKWAAGIPKTTTIVTYCGCPMDAAAVRAALTLQKLGFADVHVLHGGLEAWQAAGYPTQRAKTGAATTK